jgi:uncharacterized membrane protein YfcA
LPKAGRERPPSYLIILVVGAGLGLLSGMTATGGGIFLTPFLVLMGWCTTRVAAGISAAIILVNSSAGLVGWWRENQEISLPVLLPVWMVVVAVSGMIGSYYGSKYGSPLILRRLLAVVLMVAGAKMLLVM